MILSSVAAEGCLVVGTHGQLLGLPRVDFYHVTLAAAILLIATG